MHTLKKFSFLVVLLLSGHVLPTDAQRLHQPVGRGVVVVNRNGTSRTGEGGSGALASWRKLAQEPEGTTYNLYRRAQGATECTKVNSTPLTKTNFTLTSANLKSGSEYAVAAIIDGVEGEKSNPFLYKTQAWDNVWFNFDFDNTVLKRDDYRTKFVWPMDLDGNGEMDAVVVDRLFAGAADNDDAENQSDNTATTSHKIQAYRLDGTLLWTVDMGPNVNICAGQNDMVLAYDINCDGRCEVIIRSSDGTRFWDKENNTWGTYVGGSTKADTDQDGITDYRTQTAKNPPFYISVIDGLTGAELCHNELKYSQLSEGSGGDNYSRNNRSSYMSFGYGAMEGHYGIAYLDGIHPSLIMECEDRDTNKLHHGYILTWDFDWADGKPSNWHHSHTWVRNPKRPGCAEFHQIRILDSDGDGRDEMWGGGYGVNPHLDKFTSTGLAHGDRFIISDIDPDRPGIEGYAIQQSALLGQCLYDAATGERIKEWYLPSVYDVGRGSCMDVDPNHKGYEIYSFTDDYIYDCKGDATGETRSQWGISTCFEGFWWNGDLLREELSSPGGKGWGTNLNVTTVRGKARLIEFSRESDWGTMAATGTRPAFMGDITGDWREEVILAKQSDDHSTGLVGYSTNLPTNYSIYCLQQDPHYRGDCTTRGYYQHPNTGFYLGAGMPLPPLPPMLTADLRWKGGNKQKVSVFEGFVPEGGFTSFDMSAGASYEEGKSLIFDIYGSNSSKIYLDKPFNAPVIYLMNPQGHDYEMQSTKLWTTDAMITTGSGQLIKSMQGKVSLYGYVRHTGKTIISEGTLLVNGEITGPVELRARGTLSGTVTLKDTITFEGALNHEGCRLMPTSGNDPIGTISSKKSMTLPGNVYIEVSTTTIGNSQGYWPTCSHIYVEGDLTLKGTNYITVNPMDIEPAEYVIAECTGTLTADANNIKVRGLVGMNYAIEVREKKIVLVIRESRSAQENVAWTGSESGKWDYQSLNFAVGDEATAFVAGDGVVFPEEAKQRTITLAEKMVTSSVRFTHETGTYTFSGEGGFSGDAMLTKNGEGALVLNTTKSDYTGKTTLNGGRVTVKNLENAGTVSCFGTGAAIEIGKATLVVDNTNAATDRNLTLTDTATISIPNGATTLKSALTGKGVLVKAGNGQLNLSYSGTNGYKATILQAGTLSQGAWNSTIGSSGSAIEVQGNSSITLFNNNSTSQVPTLTNAITINQGKTLTINGGQRCAVKGSLAGSGTLKISFPYVRGDFSTNLSKFEGTVQVTSGQFRMIAATDLSKGTLQLDGGVYAASVKGGSGTETSLTHKIGALKSSATDATLSTGVWNVGYLGTNTTFAGKANGNATLNKYGDGVLTLTGQNESKININAGYVSAENTTATTTALITVNAGGTLCGTGKVAAVTVNKSGTLAAGKPNATTTGTLTLTGALNVKAGGMLLVRGRGTSTTTDKFNVSGKVAMASPVFVMERMNGEWQPGVDYNIFTGTGEITLTGTPTFEPAIPLAGYKWDYSRLVSEGVLTIVEDPDGIDEIVNSESNSRSFDLSGRPVGKGYKGLRIINGKKTLKKQ